MRVQTYSFYTSPLATSTTEKKGVLMPRLSIQLRKNDTSTVPKYDPKTMSLLLHHDLMVEFFAKKVGTRGYPLAYVLLQTQIHLHLYPIGPILRTMALSLANPSLECLMITHSLVMIMRKYRSIWKKPMSALMSIQLLNPSAARRMDVALGFPSLSSS